MGAVALGDIVEVTESGKLAVGASEVGASCFKINGSLRVCTIQGKLLPTLLLYPIGINDTVAYNAEHL